MDDKVSERLEQIDGNRKWPWNWRNEAVTETASAKIVKNLPLYARDVYDAEYRIYTSGLPKSYNLREGFDQYCRVVKDHLRQQCEKAPISLRQQAYQICDEAFELIEFLKKTTLPQVYPPVITSEPPPPDSFNVADRWDILMRKLDMCVSSGEQQEKPAETGGNAITAKIINIGNFKGVLGDIQAENVQTGDYSSIHKQPITVEKKRGIIGKILKVIVKIIGAIIVGIIVTVVTDILGNFGWLQSIKEFIYNNLWLK